MTSHLLATWKKLIKIQMCYLANKAFLLISHCQQLLFSPAFPWLQYYSCNQDAWSCFPQTNTSSILETVLQDLSVHRDPNSIYHQLRKFQFKCQFPNGATLDFQGLQLGKLLTNYVNSQSHVPNGVNHSSRKYYKKLINFGMLLALPSPSQMK